MPGCKEITKTCDQCRNNSIPGSSFCYISSHGHIQKTFWQKTRNFLRNHWQTLVSVITLPLTVIGVYWYFQDKKINATSGAISSAKKSTAMSISTGSAGFHILSENGVVFDEGWGPLLSTPVMIGK